MFLMCMLVAFVLVMANPAERVLHAKAGTTPPSHLARMKRLDAAHEARMARMKAGRLSVGEALQHRIAQAVASRKPRTPIHERGPLGKFFGLWHADACEWATAKRRNIAGATGEWRATRQAKRAEAKADRERQAREEADVIDAEWFEPTETPDVDSKPAEPGPTVADTAPEPLAPKSLDPAPAVQEPGAPIIPDVPMRRAEPTETAVDDQVDGTRQHDDTPLATVYELRPNQGEEMSAPAITSGTDTAPVNIGEITNLGEAKRFTSAFSASAETNLTESKMRADKLAIAATVSDVDSAAYAQGAAALAIAVEQIAAANVSGAVLPALTEASAAMQEIAQKEAQIREALGFAATASAENAALMATVQENVSAANADLRRHDGVAEQHQALAGQGGDKAFYANA